MPIPTRRASDVITPYCAPVEWYRGVAEAFAAARRHPNRALFGGDTLLTVPVEGGARALKAHARGSGMALQVSLHGRWPHVHLGALEALFGRTPFFPHYFPDVAEIISRPPALLADLTGGIDRIVRRALNLDALLPLLEAPAPAVITESKRIARHTEASAPMLEALFRFGPEAIFLLAKR